MTKRPFYRTSPESLGISGRALTSVSERSMTNDKVFRIEVTQADFIRELDTDSHAINNRELYKSYIVTLSPSSRKYLTTGLRDSRVMTFSLTLLT